MSYEWLGSPYLRKQYYQMKAEQSFSHQCEAHKQWNCPTCWEMGKMFAADPAPHAAAPAVPPYGSVGTITFHGPNRDVTKPYQTDLPHQAGCCCEKCRFTDPLKTQVGGDHYQKDYEIQPVEFIQRNKLGFIAGCVIKYVCRVDKGKLPKPKILQDIDKMIHYLQIWRSFLDK